MTVTSRLEAHLGERYSEHTKRAFLGQARRFVEAVGLKDSYGRDDVLAYIDTLIRGGYKAQSIQTILVGVRTFFDAQGWAWPLKAQDMRLGMAQEEPDAPALLPGDVKVLIYGVRAQRGFPAAATCLATIYGLRGDEIVRVLAEGCDGKQLSVQTAKGGRKREHGIPGVIAQHLTFRPYTVSTRRLHEEFERLMRAHVREPLPREGWHALRRSLVTGLYQNKVETYPVHRWFGWREIKDISFRYYKPSADELDKIIYDSHPFLAYWQIL